MRESRNIIARKTLARRHLLRPCCPALFSALLFVSSCGIPQYAYLEAPSVTANTDLGKFDAEFRNNSQNNPLLFQGYQLYYRLYEDEDALEEGIKKIKEFQHLTSESYNYFPLARGLNAQEEIGGKTYEAGEVDSRSPLVRLSEAQRDSTMSFSIDFLNDQIDTGISGIYFESVLKSDDSQIEIELCRNPVQNRINETATTSLARSFKKNDFYDEDGDIPEEYSSGDDLYLSIFVMTFGRQNDGTALYSKPASLGRFKLTAELLKEN